MTVRQPKLVVQMLALALCSVAVVACTANKPATSNQVQLELNATDESASNVSPSPISSPTSTTSSNVLGKTSMKQLSDFAPIAATEVTLTTNKGDIVFTLFREQAPVTTLNFLTLAQSGFYNDLVFHRVIPNFMAQVGDPLTRDVNREAMWGTGGAGYTIPDEFSSELKHDSAGIVSMANSGPNSGSSQFFITFAPTPWLDGKHTVFGKVTGGMEVLQKIQLGDTIKEITFK